jgi:hypothetical protein
MPALAAQSSWWRGRRPPNIIATEVVGPDAIADLVAARFSATAVRRRARSGIQPVTERLALLALLAARRRPMNAAELAAVCCVSRSGIRRRIRTALDCGALFEVGGLRYRTHPDWRPVVERSVAVELKLRDSARAIRQALVYAYWADSTWVLMAERPSAAALQTAKAEVLAWPHYGLTEHSVSGQDRRPPSVATSS